MAKGKGKNEQPCCTKGVPVSKDQMIRIIKDDKYNDDETRTCFWVFATDLGEKVLDHPDFKQVLGVVQKIRPKAHDIILENITAELLAAEKNKTV